MAAEVAQTTEETPEVSVEDRIAAKLGIKEPDPETTEETPPSGEEGQPQAEPGALVEVEFNGSKYEVPAELKDALMRESDYTAKTTDLSNTRKAIELQQREIAQALERQQFDQSMSQHIDQLRMLDAYIKHTNQTTDWSKLSADQIVRAKIEIDQLKDQKAEIEQQVARAWTEFQSKAAEQRKSIRSAMDTELSKSIPKWSEARPDIEKYVQGLGYPEQAVSQMSILDYQVAWKAMQFDKLKANASQTVRKASDQQGKVITPSSRKVMDSDTKSYLNYRKQLSSAKTAAEKSKIAEKRAGDKMEKLFGF
jgi:hypothetical protein